MRNSRELYTICTNVSITYKKKKKEIKDYSAIENIEIKDYSAIVITSIHISLKPITWKTLKLRRKYLYVCVSNNSCIFCGVHEIILYSKWNLKKWQNIPLATPWHSLHVCWHLKLFCCSREILNWKMCYFLIF